MAKQLVEKTTRATWKATVKPKRKRKRKGRKAKTAARVQFDVEETVAKPVVVKQSVPLKSAVKKQKGVKKGGRIQFTPNTVMHEREKHPNPQPGTADISRFATDGVH